MANSLERRPSIFSLFAGLLLALGIFATPLRGAEQPSSDTPPAQFQQMASRFEELTASYSEAKNEMEETQWVKVGSVSEAALKKLRRDDLREYLTKNRAVLDAIDRTLKFLEEPGVEANLDRLFQHAKARDLTGNWKLADIGPSSWRLRQKMFGPVSRAYQILDEHWEEWRLTEWPSSATNFKPWQKEMDRLFDESKVADKQLVQMQKPDAAEVEAKEAEQKKASQHAVAELVEKEALRLKAPTGFAGVKWLMNAEEVKSIRPKVRDYPDGKWFEAMDWLGRPAAVMYGFDGGLFVIAVVTFTGATEADFAKTQNYLQSEYGNMPAPRKTDEYLLTSTYQQGRFSIMHILRPDKSEQVTFFRTH